MSNTSKEELVDNIQEWLKIDKEVKILQNEIKERKKKKNTISNSLLDIMKNNDIECFDINNGKILYTKNNVKAPINKKHLQKCLNNYFINHPSIKSDDICNFILDNREIKTKENIRHKILK